MGMWGEAYSTLRPDAVYAVVFDDEQGTLRCIRRY